MDHLPKPEDINLTLINVPYVCADEAECSPSNFNDYPFRNGWSASDPMSLKLFAQRMQAWLYFGLLNASLEETIDRNQFLKTDITGRSVIDSSALSRRLDKGPWNIDVLRLYEWVSRPGSDLDCLDRRRIPAAKAGHRAVQVMNEVVIPFLRDQDKEQDENTDLWTSEAHAIIFSIDILIDLIIHISWPHYHRYDRPRSKYLARRHLVSESLVIARSVCKTGRCISLAWRLQILSSSWYYLLLLPAVTVSSQHFTCTSRRCKYYDVDEANYKTRHITSCLGCDFLEIDQSKLVECIENDSVPLISCFEDSGGQIQLEVTRGTLTSEYTAISHVWAGGLGNFSSNALPACIIRDLKARVERLPQFPEEYDSDFQIWNYLDSWLRIFSQRNYSFPCYAGRKIRTTFWIDTLCIPVADSLTRERQRAIKSMSQIYAGASKVIVIDPELQNISQKVEKLDYTSIVAHIRCSPSMARSWTLQEGALSAHLFVDVRDVTLNTREYKRWRNLGHP